MTTRCRIDTAREARLWFAQVVAPVCGLAITALTVPEIREAVVTKVSEIKWRAQDKIDSLRKKLRKE